MTYIGQRAGWFTTQTAKASTTPVAREAYDPLWLVVAIPTPPAPLPDSSSPYAAADQPAAQQSASISALKLEMSATEDAWVQVETDGNVIFTKVVRAADTLTFEASSRIRIATGNALGLELRLNGELVPANAAKGRVRTLEFTAKS